MDQHSILTTFAAAATLGVFLLILAARIKVSAIVVLLIGGIIAGPEFIGIVHPEALGDGLKTIINLSVGLILFEGGLTLDVKGYRTVSREIWGVLSKGVAVTWLVTAGTIMLVFGFKWDFALLSASLIIVTGPTVIGPLLHRIRVRKNIHHILHWEGVLIDPIGVFIALLCFEFFVSTTTGGSLSQVVMDFLLRFAVGAIIGIISGGILYWILKKDWVADEYLNIFTLACAIMNFAVADTIKHESGLLSVTIAGLMVGYWETPKLDKIIAYKVELKDFLIGLLFILLAANLKLDKFTTYGTDLIIIVAVVMFIVRPINIFLSTRNSNLELKEKLFLSWIAPRGIVAASMASIFAFQLANLGHEDASFLETFTYSIIAGTVIFQGFSAKLVGKFLGVLETHPTGWVIVGAHRVGRSLAGFLRDQGVSVVLVDTNAREVRAATREGYEALSEDAMAMDPDNHPSFYDCGNFLALTPNESLNRLLCQRWDNLLDHPKLYHYQKEELEEDVEARILVGEGLWASSGLDQWMAPGTEEPTLQRIQTIPANFPKPGQVLFTVVDGKVIPGCAQDCTEKATLLVVEQPQQQQEKTSLPVRKEWVIFSEDENLEELYGRMLDLTKTVAPGLDRESLLKDLLERESEFTSLLGHGISLPHSYSKAINEALLLVARPVNGIPCLTTGEDIELIFMLLSPTDQPTEHLERISNIARLIGKENGRNALKQASDPGALHDAIIDG